jgi:hypothetical protein
MLEAVELPAGIPHLDARLPYVDAYDLPHLPSLFFCSALSPPIFRISTCTNKRKKPEGNRKGAAGTGQR